MKATCSSDYKSYSISLWLPAPYFILESGSEIPIKLKLYFKHNSCLIKLFQHIPSQAF